IFGAITVYLAKHLEISGNDIDQYAQAAIMVYHAVTDCAISRNYIRDARGAGSPKDLVAIFLRSTGLYGIDIRDNVLGPSSAAASPPAFLRSISPSISIQVA